MMDDDELYTRFSFHPKSREANSGAHSQAREACYEAAEILAEICPQSRESALAIERLEEALFWANAAIARRT